MIYSLRLQCFKNFRDAELELGPLTVLVGTNASGKSNLRDAFRFLHGMSRGYSLAETIGEKYVESGVLQWRGIRGGLREVACIGERSFVLQSVLPLRSKAGGLLATKLRHRIEVAVPSGNGPPCVSRESLHRGHKLVFDSHPVDDPPAQEGSPYLFVRLPRDARNRKHGKRLRFLDNQPILSQFQRHQDVPMEYRNPAEQALSALESMRFLDLSPEVMKTPSLPGQIVLGDRGENLSSVLQAICQDDSARRSIASWIQELTPQDVVDFEFVPDQTGRVLVTLVESSGRRISAHSASDGTLRFLAMIAALLGPDVAKFYFFEELDNGIHPTRLFLLLQLIEQQARQGRVQVVATTHSPQLLAMLSETAREHASLVYRLSDASGARIRRIVDIPDAKRVLETHNLARLHESGWLEDAVSFSEEEGTDV